MRVLGEKIKEIRKQQGITQTELANLVNVKQNTMAEYENLTSTPSLFVLYKIAYVLNYDMEDFVDCPPSELPDIFEVA